MRAKEGLRAVVGDSKMYVRGGPAWASKARRRAHTEEKRKGK